MKLSRTQQELYDAMLGGVRVVFMSGINAYYFRSDSHKSCTAPAHALLLKGYAEKYDEDWKSYKLRPVVK